MKRELVLFGALVALVLGFALAYKTANAPVAFGVRCLPAHDRCEGGSCVTAGVASFCTRPCSIADQDCPEGFACLVLNVKVSAGQPPGSTFCIQGQRPPPSASVAAAPAPVDTAAAPPYAPAPTPTTASSGTPAWAVGLPPSPALKKPPSKKPPPPPKKSHKKKQR